MSQRCLGLTLRGTRCRNNIRGSAYCYFHQAQGQAIEDCDKTEYNPPEEEKVIQRPPIRHFGDLTQTPYQTSLDLERLDTTTEINAEQGIFQGEDILPEEEPLNPTIEQLLTIPFEEYYTFSYEELYALADFFGIRLDLLPPPNPIEDEVEESTAILISLLDEYYHGDMDITRLTREGQNKYYQIFPLALSIKKEENPEPCCVCMDDVSADDLLNCKHPICLSCLNQLNKAECPICRGNLTGPRVTPEIYANILDRQEIDRIRDEDANQLVAEALQTNPEADFEELYNRYYQAR